VSVMTRKKSASMPAADMQWRARKIAMQAAKLADQAGPMTRRAAGTARQGAGDAASWAKPRVGRTRAWMAARAARGSVSVQETVAPRVSSMLASAARRLDPPKQRSRRWPRMLAGTAVLAAAGAAAAAMALRSRQRDLLATAPPKPPARDNAESSVKVVNPSADAERERSEADLNGLSRAR
jgi:hypothetical protein